ncbi:helix-turn-helix domain-containing protein [Telluribacter humicola]|uniref:helix-turn-helix domain-containing protein n=1 Tax=Telluribacter humicola TaxID=1720261 RepID=UPI001A95DA1F|nr:AraC family transcriptional regulator [Telluribacter humicola]
MEPVLLKDIYPGVALQEYVQKYQVIRFVFDTAVVPPVKFHTPRPEHTITFYTRDAQRFSPVRSDHAITYPHCVVNGIYTIPLKRYGGYDFLAIKVVLQPTTLSRLRIAEVKELTDTFKDARDCLGIELSVLQEKLFRMNELRSMISTIEVFLLDLIKKRCKPAEPIDKASIYLIRHENRVSIDWLADQSCLSVRQFIRRFEEQVGVSPKMFQKILRFDRAYRLKNNHPELDWLHIALACGYYDYQHLVKDFKEFTNLTPPAFYEVEKASPERTFALHEG